MHRTSFSGEMISDVQSQFIRGALLTCPVLVFVGRYYYTPAVLCGFPVPPICNRVYQNEGDGTEVAHSE